MKKTTSLILCLAVCVLSGCASIDKQLSKIPNGEFKTFQYKRTGLGGHANIQAGPASKKDNQLIVENVDIDLDYDIFAVHIKLEGYKREVK